MKIYIGETLLTDDEYNYLESLHHFHDTEHGLCMSLQFLEKKYGKVHSVVCEFRKFVNEQTQLNREKFIVPYEESGAADRVMLLLCNEITKREK